MEEKRKYPRHKLSFPAECKRARSSKYFYTVTKDLSLEGARIISNNFLPKDETFKVSLNLVKQVFNFSARVAWCSRDRFSDRYSAGLEFFSTHDCSRNQYLSFLNSVDS